MVKQMNIWGVAALAMAMAGPVFAEDMTADSIVASVNGRDITLGHMLVLREGLPEQYQSLPDDVLFNGILDQLIQQEALAQTAETDMTRRAELGVENERRAFLAASILDATASAAVTDEALQAAYDKKFAEFKPASEFRASHILVATEDEAKAIKAEIDGGADFAEQATAKSTDSSGPGGGDLGWFGLGMMVKPFEDAVVALKPGEVSAPVQSEFGWHLIKLVETRMSEAPPLDSVRDELAAEVQDAVVQARVKELTDAAKVVRPEAGKIDPAILKNTALLGD